MDMSAHVIPKSDQMNADDLISGPRTITITKVSGTGIAEQPVAVNFEGDGGKPYKPGKSMRRVMIAAWGPDAAKYVGRRMTLFCDPGVVFGGMKVGGIRISHLSDIDRELTMALTVTKAKRAPYTVKPLAAAGPSKRDRLYAAAREAAGRGESALGEFTSGLQPAARDALKPIMAELADTAIKIPAHDPDTGVIENPADDDAERDYTYDDEEHI